MLYRTVEKTGESLSILGFGAMRLPGTKGKIDEERATKQIRYAIDQGVSYVDTAWGYHKGRGEPFLGRALGDGYRERIKLATKLPYWVIRSRQDMDYYLARQLDRLNTDHIDYYLVHSLDGPGWQSMEALGIRDFLTKAKHDGRIVNRGFSFHGDKEAFRHIVDAYDWEFSQIQYNYLDVHNQAGREGLRYAASKGLGVIVMEPLRGGKLAGNLPPQVQAIFNEADIRRSSAEWALRWVWNHPEVTVVLSGMNDESHIDENLRIADQAYADSLTDQELRIVDRAAEAFRGLMKIGCTGCQYCMPCPAGVDIQGCFDSYNQRHMFGEKRTAQFFYMVRLGGAMSGKASNASLCTACGKCVEACPQGLQIPSLLKDVRKEFEGFWFKPLVRLIRLGVTLRARWNANRPGRRSSYKS